MTSADLIAGLKKHPIGAICALITIACAVTLYFRSSIVTDSQAQSEARSAEAEKVLNNVRNSANLQEQTVEMQTLGKELEGRLVKANQLPLNLQYFYRLEAENQVKLVDVRQNPTRPSKSLYAAVPFNVTVQGSYQQVMNFLARLQNGRSFCRINSAVFTRGGPPAGGGAPDMTLVLVLDLLGQS